LHGRAVALREVHTALHRPEARGFHVGVGQDRQDTGHLRRLGAVDALQDAVRMLAADHDRVGLARQVLVVRVAALTAPQDRILQARYRLADTELGQGKGVVERIHTRTSQNSRGRATQVARPRVTRPTSAASSWSAAAGSRASPAAWPGPWRDRPATP